MDFQIYGSVWNVYLTQLLLMQRISVHSCSGIICPRGKEFVIVNNYLLLLTFFVPLPSTSVDRSCLSLRSPQSRFQEKDLSIRRWFQETLVGKWGSETGREGSQKRVATASMCSLRPQGKSGIPRVCYLTQAARELEYLYSKSILSGLHYHHTKTGQQYYKKEKLQTNLSYEHRYKNPKQNISQLSLAIRG